MNAGFIAVAAAALLLASAPLGPLSAQRRVSPGARVAPSGPQRAGPVVGRAAPGAVRRGERSPTSARGERAGPVFGRVRPRATGGAGYRGGYPHGEWPYPGGYATHGWHRGARYGHHGLYVGASFGSAFVILLVPSVTSTYLYTAPYSLRYGAGGAKTLLQGDLGEAADALAVEELADGVVRLSWRPDGRAVDEVGLFLADAQQNVLAVQTLRAAPYSALFQPTRAAAYVGITIAYADGQNTTTLLPLPLR